MLNVEIFVAVNESLIEIKNDGMLVIFDGR